LSPFSFSFSASMFLLPFAFSLVHLYGKVGKLNEPLGQASPIRKIKSLSETQMASVKFKRKSFELVPANYHKYMDDDDDDVKEITN
jgi:hypothetical protein